MKKNFSKVFVVCVIAFVAQFTNHSYAQTAVQYPIGNFSVSSLPFMGEGWENLPILVTSVTTDVNQGRLTTSKVAIENNSSRTLTKAKLKWMLSTAENPDIFLMQGETRLLNLHDGIEAGETREIIFPIVSFGNLYKSLMRGNTLNGKYIIQVALSEAKFADGTRQNLLAKNKVPFIKVAMKGSTKK